MVDIMEKCSGLREVCLFGEPNVLCLDTWILETDGK